MADHDQAERFHVPTDRQLERYIAKLRDERARYAAVHPSASEMLALFDREEARYLDELARRALARQEGQDAQLPPRG